MERNDQDRSRQLRRGKKNGSCRETAATKGLREPTCDRHDIHMPILLQGLQIKDRSPQPPESMSPGIYLFPVIFGPEETAIIIIINQGCS